MSTALIQAENGQESVTETNKKGWLSDLMEETGADFFYITKDKRMYLIRGTSEEPAAGVPELKYGKILPHPPEIREKTAGSIWSSQPSRISCRKMEGWVEMEDLNKTEVTHDVELETRRLVVGILKVLLEDTGYKKSVEYDPSILKTALGPMVHALRYFDYCRLDSDEEEAELTEGQLLKEVHRTLGLYQRDRRALQHLYLALTENQEKKAHRHLSEALKIVAKIVKGGF